MMPGLEDLYREIILDHYRNPRNRGELPSPPAVRAEGFNPLCGDEVVVYLQVADGTIADLKTSGQGCSISQSSASMMSTAVKGKTLAQARATIKAFRSMMSLHEQQLDHPPEEANPTDQPSAGAREAASGEGATQPVPLGDLEALQGVVKFPVRIKCATLCWHTLAQALDEAEAATKQS